MRYTLENGQPKRVKWVVEGETRTSNPPDEMVDSLGAGMVLVEAAEPEYDPETQYTETSYAVVDGTIVMTITLIDIPIEPSPDDQITELQLALAEVYEMRTL